jgi:hypothetical protein
MLFHVLHLVFAIEAHECLPQALLFFLFGISYLLNHLLPLVRLRGPPSLDVSFVLPIALASHVVHHRRAGVLLGAKAAVRLKEDIGEGRVLFG